MLELEMSKAMLVLETDVFLPWVSTKLKIKRERAIKTKAKKYKYSNEGGASTVDTPNPDCVLLKRARRATNKIIRRAAAACQPNCPP